MSSPAAVSACTCGSIGRADLRLCAEHHRYWRGDRELASVTKVIKSTWSVKPDYSSAPAEVLEHARERGIRVDRRFTEYLNTGSLRIGAGEEWQEVGLLVRDLIKWWKTTTLALGQTQAQVLLADDDIAGTCDLICEGIIADLKTTHDIEALYAVQVGAYADLYEATFQKPPSGLGIIHLHKRFREPKWIPLDMEECRRDWRILRDCWRMVQRRSA